MVLEVQEVVVYLRKYEEDLLLQIKRHECIRQTEAVYDYPVSKQNSREITVALCICREIAYLYFSPAQPSTILVQKQGYTPHIP